MCLVKMYQCAVSFIALTARKSITLVTLTVLFQTIVTEFIFFGKQETLSRLDVFEFFTFVDSVIATTKVESQLCCQIAIGSVATDLLCCCLRMPCRRSAPYCSCLQILHKFQSIASALEEGDEVSHR